MRQSQLKAFHHVALLGGFSRAAEALFLTQPAISEQVRKLEQDHDVLLFLRARKQVTLTPAGEELFRLTKQLFEIDAQIDEYMSETRAAVAGTLRIIADSAHHVTDILTRFRQKYPNVVVTLRTGNSQEVLDELRAYNAELGVVGSLSPGRDMAALSLGETGIIAFAARGLLPADKTSISLAELAELPLIFRETGSKTRQKLQEATEAQGIVLTPAIEAEGRETVRELVASGAGIGFVSEAEFGHDTRLVQIRLRDVDATMSEALVHMRQRQEVRVIRAFMEVARTELSGQ
ncbi:MAG: LysR family transcriptional regulator [Rhodobacteraceae bacterium]|nr:LysR family transcriptional regulator [Paracoccaceae bacterium]